jgi:large subunit ribosomal protein L1
VAGRTSLSVVQEALEKAPERKFTETVELAVNLKDLDLSVPKNRLEEEIPLPNGRGRPMRVAVFGSAEMLQKVRTVADRVIAASELDDVAKDRKAAKRLAGQVDFFLAEAPLMPTIGRRLGVVLGPRGKMPRPIPPGSDPSNIVRALQRSIRVRSKGNRTLHAAIGTRGMPADAIAGNADAVLARLVARLERGRTNIESVYVKTTMGPSVRLW